jgi:hypothetical protein
MQSCINTIEPPSHSHRITVPGIDKIRNRLISLYSQVSTKLPNSSYAPPRPTPRPPTSPQILGWRVGHPGEPGMKTSYVNSHFASERTLPQNHRREQELGCTEIDFHYLPRTTITNFHRTQALGRHDYGKIRKIPKKEKSYITY